MSTLGHIKTVVMEVCDLTHAIYNPRKISEQAKLGLSNSIKTFGLVQPIVWNKRTNTVVGGYQRLNELIELGAKKTKVVVVDIPLIKEKTLNIVLNHSGVSGEFEDEQLQAVLQEVAEKEEHIFKDTQLELLLETWSSPGDDPNRIGDYEEGKDTFFIKIPEVELGDVDYIISLLNNTVLAESGYEATTDKN